jgi:hypothetical protein
MMTATTTEAATSILATLEVGMMLTIPGRKQPVRVTEVVTYPNGSVNVYTTSGRVRPGAYSGGLLQANGFRDTGFLFQATLQQQVVSIDGFEIAGFAN